MFSTLSVTARKLHTAIEDGKADRVARLLRERADVEVRDECGVTPLFNAAHLGHDNIVKVCSN